MTTLEYQAWMQAEKYTAERRRWLVILFVITLFGLPAPLTGAIAGFQAYRHHEELAGEHGPFLALGYGAATIGVVYTLIFLLLFLGR